MKRLSRLPDHLGASVDPGPRPGSAGRANVQHPVQGGLCVCLSVAAKPSPGQLFHTSVAVPKRAHTENCNIVCASGPLTCRQLAIAAVPLAPASPIFQETETNRSRQEQEGQEEDSKERPAGEADLSRPGEPAVSPEPRKGTEVIEP